MTKPIIGRVDDLNVLLDLLPKRLSTYLRSLPNLTSLIEVVLDLGCCPEVRFSHTVYRLKDLGEITIEDIKGVTKRTGIFNDDNRAGIERTLHRISAIRNRTGDIIGLTCRIGRAIEGTVDIIQDIVESGQNCLFLGPPGVGKTTLLREVARILSTVSQKRVIVVDTSNEIAGDGNIPHPGIGFARRMQVPSPNHQHAVMIEAVENHMPEVIIVDEIGTEEETKACRTIAERGVQLVGTAHGYAFENLIKNPTLEDLIGGFHSVILGDEEAKFRGTKKSIIERKGLPTFDVIIELRARDVFAIFNPTAMYIDAFLKDDPIEPEIRKRIEDGEIDIKTPEKPISTPKIPIKEETGTIYIFPFGINISRIKLIAESLQVPLHIANEISDADMILTTKSKATPKGKVVQLSKTHKCPLHIIATQENADITKFLRSTFKLSASDQDLEEEAIREVHIGCKKVIEESRYFELSPQPGFIRHLQHEIAHEYGLNSMSTGEDPNRRLRVYPRV